MLFSSINLEVALVHAKMGDASEVLDELIRPALLIPGPVDFDRAVLKAMSKDA